MLLAPTPPEKHKKKIKKQEQRKIIFNYLFCNDPAGSLGLGLSLDAVEGVEVVGHVGHEGGAEAGSDHEEPGSDVELQLQEADGSTRTCERAMEAK